MSVDLERMFAVEVQAPETPGIDFEGRFDPDPARAVRALLLLLDAPPFPGPEEEACPEGEMVV